MTVPPLNEMPTRSRRRHAVATAAHHPARKVVKPMILIGSGRFGRGSNL